MMIEWHDIAGSSTVPPHEEQVDRIFLGKYVLTRDSCSSILYQVLSAMVTVHMCMDRWDGWMRLKERCDG